MLAPWSVYADSATWLRVAVSGFVIAAMLAACGDDPTPKSAPAATPVSQPWRALPSTFDEYARLAEEDPAGRESMIDENIATLSEDIRRDPSNADAVREARSRLRSLLRI